MASSMERWIKAVGCGEFGSNSHPIHPSTVHFPIAFLSLSNALNILYGLAAYLPALSPFAVDKENLGTLAIAGYFSNVAGIVTAVPTVLSGFAELYAMVKARGLFVRDEKTGKQTLEPVVKVTLTHATINDLAIFIAVYNWMMERNRVAEDYAPHGHQILLSAAAMGMTLFAAFLGGSLVYKHGVGVQRMGEGKEEKQKSKSE